MGYIQKSKRKAYLLIGFFSMLLCGVSDCLLSYMGDGEPHVLAGIISADIVNVPLCIIRHRLSSALLPAWVIYWLPAQHAFIYSTGRTVTEQDCISHFLLARP